MGVPRGRPGKPIVAMCRTSLIFRISTQTTGVPFLGKAAEKGIHRSSARRSNPSNLCHPPTLAYTDLEVGRTLEQLISSQEGRLHFGLRVPHDPPLPGPDRDLDNSKELLLLLPSPQSLTNHSPTPQGHQGEEEGPDSSSRRCVPTRSFH